MPIALARRTSAEFVGFDLGQSIIRIGPPVLIEQRILATRPLPENLEVQMADCPNRVDVEKGSEIVAREPHIVIRIGVRANRTVEQVRVLRPDPSQLILLLPERPAARLNLGGVGQCDQKNSSPLEALQESTGSEEP